MKEIRGFLLAPIPAALFGALVSWLSGGWPRPVSIAVFYLILLYGIQLLFGIAIRAFLVRTGRISSTSFCAGGVAMTSLPAALYLAWASSVHPEKALLAAVVWVIWSIMGGLNGLFYWWLTRQLRASMAG